MSRTEIWKRKDPWTWRELALLMFLEFVFVMIVVKYGMQSIYEMMFENTLYSGTWTGLTIAVVLLTGLYLAALRPNKLSWAKVGVTGFPARDWWWIGAWTLVLILLSMAAVILTSFIGNTVDNSKTESLQQNITWFTVLIGIVSAGGALRGKINSPCVHQQDQYEC